MNRNAVDGQSSESDPKSPVHHDLLVQKSRESEIILTKELPNSETKLIEDEQNKSKTVDLKSKKTYITEPKTRPQTSNSTRFISKT